MIAKIIHTLGSRAISMLLNLVMLFITTRWMGAENKGEISILILNLSLTAIFSGLFGGPSLVYLAARFQLKNLILINYLWSIITSIIVAIFFYLNDLPLTVSPKLFIILGILECFAATNLMLLLGREQIKEHNWVQIIKVSITVCLLAAQFSIGTLNFDSFVTAYVASLCLTFVISLALLLKVRSTNHREENLTEIIKACFMYGGLVQIGSIAQLLNYRLSYYIIELITSPPKLALIRIGIFHTAVQVAEALWQFARSISTVQYAHVSNLSSRKKGIEISMQLAKLNYTVTLIALLVLMLIPSAMFIDIFGSEFHEVKTHLWFLGPGILLFSVSNAFSHFLAGVGDHKYNTYTSLFGLALTSVLIYPAVKHFGTIGAAAITSTIYCLQTIIQFAFLKRSDGINIQSLMIQKSDFIQLNLLFSKLKDTK